MTSEGKTLIGTPNDTVYLLMERKYPVVFGRVLRRWLEDSGRTQRALAIKLFIDSSQVSKWVRGKRSPGRERVTQTLIHIHNWLKGAWEVSEALDGITWLGLSWEDVEVSLEEDFQFDSVPGYFRRWWEDGQPQKQANPVRAIPTDYVEPEELEDLRLLVAGMQDYRQPAFNGVVVHGISGAGKTTLALALARSEVVDWVFRDGIVWLDEEAEDLRAEAQRKAGGVYGDEEEWRAWIRADDRRLLIIIDDLTDVKHLRDFLKQGLGPQVTVLVTTQRGAEVVGEMGRFFREEDIAELEITGLGEKKGHQFVKKVLGRELKETELEVVAEVGEIVGWHPEGLRLAAQMARDDLLTWRDVLSDLRDVEESTVLYRLERWVIRHWRRMESQEREQAQRLLDAMERGGPFGALFASAAWNVEIGQARVRLLRMERDGLIERMAGHPVEYWWSEVGEQWRALPIVYRVRGRSGSSDEGAEWWRSVARRVERSFGLSGRMRKRFPKMPTALGVVGAGGLLAFSPLKAVGEGFLLLGELVGSGQDWKLRWNDWTIINKVESHLKDHWERAGWQPTEELWMLYKRNNLLIYLIFLIQLSVLATLFLLQKQTFFVDLMALIFVSGAGLAVSYRGAWRVWVACLYGVHTWDLELMLRVSLWLTQRLSWISSMQEDQDMLQEVLMRVRGERVD